MTDLDHLGETLAAIRCSHSMLLGESLSPFVPERFRHKVTAAIYCAGAVFYFDMAGRFIGTAANRPEISETNHGKGNASNAPLCGTELPDHAVS